PTTLLDVSPGDPARHSGNRREVIVKKEIPQGAIIGAIVLVVLIVIGFAWRTLSDSTPPRVNMPEGAVKPDALPEGAPAGRSAPRSRNLRSDG
ncbi:MAG: hypothetical protein JWN14_2520, partial [Chthonomonadales bacterium]|nr:hypothetical protein [Chthonomonadales bacterium]